MEVLAFTLTDLGAITINMAWTKGTNSTYTMIRVSGEDYPTSPTEGELAYYGDGTTENTSGYDLDVCSFFFQHGGLTQITRPIQTAMQRQQLEVKA